MNEVTRWFEHKLYTWMDPGDFSCMETALKERCTLEYVRDLLSSFDNLHVDAVNYYASATYEEEEKTCLDNISSFYEIRVAQRVAQNHVGSMRIYLPVAWNGRFMGMAGAGTNTEVDWFTAVRFNVITWPIALKNGYACAVADNATGIHLDCTWGFDADGKLEWDHIKAWAENETIHQMTVCGKLLTTEIYGQVPLASYMHGTSGGARETLTEAIRYPKDYDGLWADAPSIDHVNLSFACLWACLVEQNEKHVVALGKYKKARAIALADPVLRYLPFDSTENHWRNYIHGLYGVETEAGVITRQDVQIMVKTWEGPILLDGRHVAYGFGPTIRQWPLEAGNPMYGYFKRIPDGRLGLMPIAEQMMRWYTGEPDFDFYDCTYQQFAEIYDGCHKKFDRYDFNEADLSAYAEQGGKLIVTHGTGDCVVPYQQMMDYYIEAMEHFPSEKSMNESFRLFMPELSGHSILDWSGPAVSIADGMRALTAWTEQGIKPEKLPTQKYDFAKDTVVEEGQVEAYKQWHYKARIKRLRER